MREVYVWMLDELLGRRPSTIKVPGRYGGYVRVAVETNPEWYRELCESHKSARGRFPKPRTIIRRCDVLRALVLLADGQRVETTYAERIRAVARKYRQAILAERNSRKSHEDHEAEMTLLPEF
jgi:hypothetical protein